MYCIVEMYDANHNNHNNNQGLNAHLRRGSFLRPAISVTLLKADEQVDCVMYVLRVTDIRSGVGWIIRRRFREFFELREVLVRIHVRNLCPVCMYVCNGI